MKDKPVHITALELENVKRVRAVAIDCDGKPLTVIGGKNGQGKTSILDAIMWALGGDRYKPSNPVHEGAEECAIKVELDNGITVERKGKNGALKVTSPNGRGGQALLNEFVNLFALNLPKFMGATAIEKTKMLLDALPDGIGAKLQKFNEEIKKLYDERHAMGQIADRKRKYADELPFDSEVPEQPLSGTEMAKRLQDALAHNAHNQSLRAQAGQAKENVKGAAYRVQSAEKRVADLQAALKDAMADLTKSQAQLKQAEDQATAAAATAKELRDQDTSAVESEMEKIDSINARIRANESKRMAEAEADHLREQYNDITAKIEDLRAERIQLLRDLEMPLDGLSVDEDGELLLNGQKWDCMSGAEQLRVSAAICAGLNDKCGFVLLDRLEAMDSDTLAEFGEWLAGRGLQAIGTRVGTGDDCSIIIEDGVIAGSEPAKPRKSTKQSAYNF